MINQTNILRQITDVQIQAERLITRKSNLQEIEEFAEYSNEIKLFLLDNIKEDFILSHVHQIPDLLLDDSGSKSRIVDILTFSFDFGLGIYSRERRKVDKALKIVRNIRGKYASVEFMLKNYFN